MSCHGPAQRGLDGKGDILRGSSSRGEGGLCPSAAYTKAILSTKQSLLRAVPEAEISKIDSI